MSTTTETFTVDPDSGRVALPRRLLTPLGHLSLGVPARPDVMDELREVGALTTGDQPHPLLQPIVHVLVSVKSRAVLRRWRGATLPAVELFIGDGGVVVLPNGVEQDTAQEVRWHHRPRAAPRLIAEMLDLPLVDAPAVVDEEPRPWHELVRIARDPDNGLGLADLRWAKSPRRPPESVLVVLWHTMGGIAEVVPAAAEPDAPVGGAQDDNRRVQCRHVHPLQVWTGLTRVGQPGWTSVNQ